MSAPLEQQDKARDANFSKAMHGSSAKTGAFTAMFTKDKKAHNAAVDEYFKFWEEEKGASRMGEEDSEVWHIVPCIYNATYLRKITGAAASLCYFDKTV